MAACARFTCHQGYRESPDDRAPAAASVPLLAPTRTLLIQRGRRNRPNSSNLSSLKCETCSGRLLRAHGDCRVDPRRPQRRNPARHDPDRRHHHRHADERDRVVRRDTEEQPLNDAAAKKAPATPSTRPPASNTPPSRRIMRSTRPARPRGSCGCRFRSCGALTENPSTPAIPTAAMITARMPNDETSTAFSAGARRSGPCTALRSSRPRSAPWARCVARCASPQPPGRDVAVRPDRQASAELLRAARAARRPPAGWLRVRLSVADVAGHPNDGTPIAAGRVESQDVHGPRDPPTKRGLTREELGRERLVGDVSRPWGRRDHRRSERPPLKQRDARRGGFPERTTTQNSLQEKRPPLFTMGRSGETAVAESGGERNPTVPAGRTSRHRIGAGDRSAGVAAVPARRARPRDTRMPGVGAPPRVATRADIANRYHWVAILRAGRHDYSSSARSSRATASLDRRSSGMMAVIAQVVPREHRVPKFAEASRGSRPVPPEHPEGVAAPEPIRIFAG